ncbi:hypothetical protein [Rhodococcus sp. NPDC057529]|uniref:hypothetical protein n=1 Tax=Rhodococcus sp. NPDC057529 TaxID=3346158 RepID=UPI0036724464
MFAPRPARARTDSYWVQDASRIPAARSAEVDDGRAAASLTDYVQHLPGYAEQPTTAPTDSGAHGVGDELDTD